MDLDARRMGELTGYALLAMIPLFFLIQAVRAQKRSLRFANLSLACGLNILLNVTAGIKFPAESRMTVLCIDALVRGAIAAAGLVFAIVALRARARDGGTGLARPIVAIVINLLLGFVLAATLILALYFDPLRGQSWDYSSAAHGYRITLPSANWTPAQDAAGGEAFACRVPSMHAVVYAQPTDEAGYAASAAESRRIAAESKDPVQPPQVEEARTQAGWPCSRVTMVERGEDGGRGPTFVSVASVRWAEKGLTLTVLFEGELGALSETVRAMQLEACTRSARAIQISLGPPR